MGFVSLQALMSPERIERLFFSQQRWEDGDVGSVCEHDPDQILTTKQFVLQYFSGLMKLGRCEFLTFCIR